MKSHKIKHILLMVLLFVHAAVNAQNVKIDLSLANVPLKQFIVEVEKRTNYTFMMDNTIDKNQRITVKVQNQPLSTVLAQALSTTKLTWTVMGTQVILKAKETISKGALKKISGTVVDERGDPVIGANIMVKGTTNGVITDIDGQFSIDAVPSNTLVVTYIGYSPKEVMVSSQATYSIQLTEDTQKLEEVVVVGYGTSSKKKLTTSVSDLKSESFQEMPITNIGDAFSGQMTGVVADNGTGQPGAAPVIRIRGYGSINAGSEPLYVIDGVMASASMFAALNPKSIEKIDVLKDAAAGAIYGSRAGNGVIQVTTKKGKYGDGRLAVSATYGVQQIDKKVGVLDRDQWLSLVREAYANDGKSVPDYYNRPNSEFVNTNWQDEIYRTSSYQNYQVSATGATDKVSYYIDGNYLDNQGIMLTTFSRTISSTGNFEFKVKPRWKVGLNYNAMYGKERNNNSIKGFGHQSGGYGIAGGIIQQSLWMPPIVPVYTADGDYGQITQGEFAPYFPAGYANPVCNLLETNDQYDKVKALGRAYISYEPIDGLVINAALSATADAYQREYYTSPYLSGNSSQLANFSKPYYDKMTAGQSTNLRTSWVADLYANYKKSFKEIHTFDFTLGFSAQYDGYTATTATASANDRGSANALNPIPIFSNYYRPNIYGAALVLGGGSFWETSFESIFARVNYSLMDRYLFMVSMRRDGSSKFAPDKRFGYFPALSAAWRMKEEPFLKDVNWLTDLKVRASYGVSGNDQFGAYQWQGKVNYNQIYTYGPIASGASGSGLVLIPNSIENRNLSWETNEQINVGVDFSAFDGRVNLTADYFIRNTKNMLLNRSLPLENGITASILDNVGNMSNKGIEIGLNTVNIKTKDWTWSTNINFTKINNKVDEVFTSTGYIQYNADFSGSGFESALRIIEGQPMFQLYSYKVLGTFETAEQLASLPKLSGNERIGDPIVEDYNKDDKINTDDLQPMGQALPDFNLGFTSSLKYKNFDLNIVVDGAYGASKIITGARQASLMRNSENTLQIFYDDRYRAGESNHKLSAPSTTVTGPRHSNMSYFIYDASYTRIKNISVGYTLPRSACSKLKIHDLRVMLGIQNAYTFTSYPLYNPMANTNGGDSGKAQFGVDNGNYPMSRIYTIGLNFSF